MSFGNLFSSPSSQVDAAGQQQLAGLQENLNLFGGMMQQQEADQQAQSLQQEGGFAYQMGLYNAQQAKIQGVQAYGQQAETFASSGIQMQGSPINVLNETRSLTDLQVSMYEQQGSLEQQLYDQQANQTQMQGLTDYLGALGQNVATAEGTDIQIAQEENQISSQQSSALLGFGSGLADSLAPSLAKLFIP